MANRLDAMAVRIADESGVIVGMIGRPETRWTIVAATCSNCRRVESPDRGAVRGTKAEVVACRRRRRGFSGDGELDAERARGSAVVRSAPFEINGADKPKRAQRGVIEAARTVEIADAQ